VTFRSFKPDKQPDDTEEDTPFMDLVTFHDAKEQLLPRKIPEHAIAFAVQETVTLEVNLGSVNDTFEGGRASIIACH
jgi:hypothetical protein